YRLGHRPQTTSAPGLQSHRKLSSQHRCFSRFLTFVLAGLRTIIDRARGRGLGVGAIYDSKTPVAGCERQRGSLCRPCCLLELEDLDVLRLPSLGAALHFEADCLAFLQRTETVRLDCREMNEYILAVLS